MGCTTRLTTYSIGPTFKSCPGKFPTIPVNIVHTYHVGFYVDFHMMLSCYGLLVQNCRGP